MIRVLFRYFFSCFLLFAIAEASLAQTSAGMPDYTPPSPEAASLFKFVETPVSLNDGMAQISIPIYTIQAGGLEVPVELSYHSRGIKVSEVASRVGLGWTLMAGGKVSRQIRGKADDENGYMDEDFYDDFFDKETTRNAVYQRHLNDPVDFDPDLFYFSFPGHSGKFIFDHGGASILVQDFKDIQIEATRGSPSGGLIEQFKITDEYGNVFWFGQFPGMTGGPIADRETTGDYRYAFEGGGITPLDNIASWAKSSWHLLKIETFKGAEILFNYTIETPKYVRKSYDVNELDQNIYSYYSEVTAYQHQLASIIFPGGKLVFNPESSFRQDLSQSHALENIELYDDTGTTKIKSWELQYEYRVNSNTQNTTAPLVAMDPHADTRLYLKRVTEVSGDGKEKPPYELSYNNIQLPNRFSTSQDTWGYYNGADNGPFLTFFDYGTYGVDRRVDTVLNQAGMLTSLSYPTGGRTHYQYEQNIGVKPPELDQLVTQGSNPIEGKSLILSHIEHGDYYDSSARIYEKPFTIGPTKVGWIDANTYFDNPGCTEGDYTPDCNFTVVVVGVSHSYSVGLNYGSSILVIPPGDYIMRVYAPRYINGVPYNPVVQGHGFIIDLNWQEESPMEDASGQPLLLAGGKRIKAITHRKSDNSIAWRKEFEYVLPSGGSSGEIIGLPNFYAIQKETSLGNVLWSYGSLPGSPLTNVTGNEISYSHVNEYFGTKTNNIGKIAYSYSNPRNGGDFYHFPYHLPVDNQWLRGKPLTTRFYQKTAADYELVREIENTYLYGGNLNLLNDPGHIALFPFFPSTDSVYIDHTRVAYSVPLAVFTPDSVVGSGHNYKVYYQTGGTADLYSTTIKDYFPQGNQTIVVEKERIYKYNYDKHYQVASETTTHSSGKKETTYYFFPAAVDSSDDLGYHPLSSPTLSAIQELKASHRPAEILQIKSVMESEGSIVKETAIRRDFRAFESGVYPTRILSLQNGTNSLIPRLHYKSYDTRGNPIEIARQAGPSVFYFWSSSSKPIAKIENTSATALEGALTTALEHVDESHLNQINDLRTLLPHAFITTYALHPAGMIEEMTGPGNTFTQFRYDDFLRLEKALDHEDYILFELQYGFKDE